MRSHGVPNFPDLNPNGSVNLPSGINPQAPAFQTAEQSCARLRPAAGSRPPPISLAQQKSFVANAQCVRRHGVPNFPDPVFGAPAVRASVTTSPREAFQTRRKASFKPNTRPARTSGPPCHSGNCSKQRRRVVGRRQRRLAGHSGQSLAPPGRARQVHQRRRQGAPWAGTADVSAAGSSSCRSCSRTVATSDFPYGNRTGCHRPQYVNLHAAAACLNTGDPVLIVFGIARKTPSLPCACEAAELGGREENVGSGKPDTPCRRMHSESCSA